MGYMHIDNLYKNQTVLLFKEVFALEKIHGTSAHVSYDGENVLTFFSGGVSYNRFVALFNQETLLAAAFQEHFRGIPVTVYGEAYGGSCQKMSDTYGDKLRFVAFDVCVDETFVNVDKAYAIACKLDIPFVWYDKVTTDLAQLDRVRDMDSIQGSRNGIPGMPSEGIVIRPLEEFVGNNGKRVMAKHKKDKFRETTKVRKVVDPAQMEVLRQADEIAEEWVTSMRLSHVVDKIDGIDMDTLDVSHIGRLIKPMIEDVKRESEGEVIWSTPVEKAISKKTALLIKLIVKGRLTTSD